MEWNVYRLGFAVCCLGSAVNLGLAAKLTNALGCTGVIADDTVCPDEKNIHFLLNTRANKNASQTIRINGNLSGTNFAPEHPTKILIHGYDSSPDAVDKIKDQYLIKGDYNVILVDWSTLAATQSAGLLSFGTCYFQVALSNVRHVGRCVAQLVEKLADVTEDLHVISHSMGVIVAANAAAELRKKTPKYVLPRITGLDPAFPGYLTASNMMLLDPHDADFVDVIHTNMFLFGDPRIRGYVDFYLNGGTFQPGCKYQISCSHQRAVGFFAESINSEKGFWGWHCSSVTLYYLGFCFKKHPTVLMGDGAVKNPSASGIVSVRTKSSSPFAKGK